MNAMVRHFFRYQFPAVAWAAMIFIASSIPGHNLPKFALMINDKVIHATIFFVLGMLVYRALEPRVKVEIFNWRRLLLAVTVVVAYGFVDEFHQSFVPGRTVDIKDASADAVGGIVAGIIIYFASFRKRNAV